MTNLKRLFAFVLICMVYESLSAQQQPPFFSEVQTIKTYDTQFAPPLNPIVFTGSSSIRKWDYLQRDFGGYVVLNRGIGGAVTNDIINYTNDLIIKYKPRQVVLYVGENDVVDAKTTADSILNRVKRLYTKIRTALPYTPIAYISMKPSPSREQFLSKVKEGNMLIQAFLATQPNTAFIDIYSLMLTKDGKFRSELFVGDCLHMNSEGYKIWAKGVKPYLIKAKK